MGAPQSREASPEPTTRPRGAQSTPLGPAGNAATAFRSELPQSTLMAWLRGLGLRADLSLTELPCWGMELTELPAGISQLTQLYLLDCSRNSIAQLPATISTLTCLRELSYNHNQLKQIPDSLSSLTGLLVMNCSNNQISQLPDGISTLTRLQQLCCSYNQLNQIPEWISRLTSLQELDCSNNRLYRLPPGMSALTGLHLVNCSNNQLTHLPVGFSALLGLHGLSCSNNRLNQLPEGISLLISLNELDISNNQLTQLPDGVSSLTGLQKLRCSFNQLSQIPKWISQLTVLQELDCSNNLLLQLPREIGSLANLQELKCTDNSFGNIPKEVVTRGSNAVISYLRELWKNRPKEQLRMKLVLLGSGGVGKTALARRLTGQQIELEGSSTDGINTVEWEVKVSANSPQLTFSVFDFAGQEIYYTSHPLFLSERSVYLILWNMREGTNRDQRLEFWLQSVHARAPNSPIILVGTHADLTTESASHYMCDTKFGYQIKDVYQVSNKNGKGVEALKQYILQLAAEEARKMTIPDSYARLFDYLRDQRVSGVKLLDWASFRTDTMGKFGFDDEEPLEVALQFASDIGLSLYYEAIRKQLVIVEPQWLIDVLKAVISSKQSATKELEKAQLLRSQAHLIWPNKPWGHRLIDILLEFRLAYPTLDYNHHLIPCRLQEAPPVELEQWQQQLKPRWQIKFEFLPADLFPVIQASKSLYPLTTVELAKRPLVWKNGSAFCLRKNTLGLLLCCPNERSVGGRITYEGTLDFWAAGQDAEELFLKVRLTILQLLSTKWPSIKIQQRVPCYECQNSWLPLDPLADMNDTEWVSCPECYKKLAVSRLKGIQLLSLEQLLPVHIQGFLPHEERRWLREKFISDISWERVELPLFSFLRHTICEEPSLDNGWHIVETGEENMLSHVSAGHLSSKDVDLTLKYLEKAGEMVPKASLRQGSYEGKLQNQPGLYRVRVDESKRPRWLCYHHTRACLASRKDPKADLAPMELAVALKWEQEGEAEGKVVNAKVMSTGRGIEHANRVRAVFLDSLQFQHRMCLISNVEVVLHERIRSSFAHFQYQVATRRKMKEEEVTRLMFYDTDDAGMLAEICENGFQAEFRQTGPLGEGHYCSLALPSNVPVIPKNRKVLIVEVICGVSATSLQQDCDSYKSSDGTIMVSKEEHVRPLYMVTFGVQVFAQPLRELLEYHPSIEKSLVTQLAEASPSRWQSVATELSTKVFQGRITRKWISEIQVTTLTPADQAREFLLRFSQLSGSTVQAFLDALDAVGLQELASEVRVPSCTITP